MTGRIAIVGAGPAGLTAAIVARRLGLEAVVYEQAPELTRVGGGIAIQNNGQRVLDAVGLLSGFAARMATADTIAIEGPGGRDHSSAACRRHRESCRTSRAGGRPRRDSRGAASWRLAS
jgi:2-polyprenyl-6-methoxyphenol hydroxylase-like FAD-dependent oxidoreductase